MITLISKEDANARMNGLNRAYLLAQHGYVIGGKPLVVVNVIPMFHQDCIHPTAPQSGQGPVSFRGFNWAYVCARCHQVVLVVWY